MKHATNRPSRRQFLFAATGAGAVAAAAAVVVPDVAPKPDPREATRRDGRGYTETAHIRNYYRTAKV